MKNKSKPLCSVNIRINIVDKNIQYFSEANKIQIANSKKLS
jgi:hypothetical protein